MSKKETNKVTIANIITILGVVFMALVVFCAQSWQNYNDNIGSNLIFAGVISAVAVLFLWLMVHAKKVEKDFKSWFFVEIMAILLYAGVACFAGTKMLHFFSITENFEEVKQVAMSDANNIESLLDEFREKEKERCDRHCDGINNQFSVQNGRDSISKDERNKLKKKIENIEDEDAKMEFSTPWTEKIDSLKKKIEDWNPLTLADIAKELDVLSMEVGSQLTKCSEQYEFYTFAFNSNHKEKSQPNKYSYNAKFPQSLRDTPYNSVIGIILILFINLLILSSYIFASRSSKVLPKGKGHFEGGAPLI